ncbi:MAG TPA: aminotransferase class V-fold PLP-dependent enzyme [Gemmatimonadales bacterium]|nr:aminotransferase class V-fold PLP-dependent enzyme [Gemmatimonadales bacterium]
MPALAKRATSGVPARLTVGSRVRVPVLGGGERRYVNLDNAASTPPFTGVLKTVNRFSRWYSNVHRGMGFKSRLSSHAFEEARDSVARFVRARPSDVVIFCRNTTHGINQVARRLDWSHRPVVLVSSMEHHSNDLPWRKVGQVIHIQLDAAGRIDEEHFRSLLRQHGSRIGVVAVTGASNVTGIINPVHRYARLAHEVGARILVDAAQLAPHRAIDMRPATDPAHLDFVVFSGHKIYAPFGAGVLVGPRQLFLENDPYEVGGGTVDVVNQGEVAWTGLPDREEAGTPCIVGAIALAAAIERIQEIGWPAITGHESALTSLALRRLGRIPGLTLYGDAEPTRAKQRLGVIAFNLEGRPHALVAAILSHEWAVGTRSGCFCAQIHLKHLLGIDEAGTREIKRRILAGDRRDGPGAVRLSMGAYNTVGDIDRISAGLEAIAAGDVRGKYRVDAKSGEYHPTGTRYDYGSYYRG